MLPIGAGFWPRELKNGCPNKTSVSPAGVSSQQLRTHIMFLLILTQQLRTPSSGQILLQNGSVFTLVNANLLNLLNRIGGMSMKTIRLQ